MMKARANREGQLPLILFGLSDKNLDKLREGKPILVKGDSLGIEAEFLIMWGETEAHITKSLLDAGMSMGAETTVDERLIEPMQALGVDTSQMTKQKPV